MSLLIGFLTFVLVVDCLFLMFMILLQLPKKEAGAGIAFGGAATDALFGAGSGNALTKMTKYSASLFIGLALLLSFMNTNRTKDVNRGLEQELLKKANAPGAQVAPPALPTNQLSLAPTNQVTPAAAPIEATNQLKTIVQTNQPAAATNAVPTNPPAANPAAPAPPPAPVK